MTQAFNPSIQEEEVSIFLSSRPKWSAERVLGQPDLHTETIAQKTKQQQKSIQSHTHMGKKFIKIQLYLRIYI